MSAVILFVAYDHDALSEAITERLRGTGAAVRRISPPELNDLRVCLEGDLFFADGQRVGGVLFRCRADAHFSRNFTGPDSPFADAEARALWLAALHLESVKAINRHDAVTWFDDSSWTVWRRRFAEAGVSISPFTFGNQPPCDSRFWQPHRGGRLRPEPEPALQRVLGAALTPSKPAETHLLVLGEPLSDEPGTLEALPSLHAAGRVLARNGIGLAELTTDDEGNVLSVETVPVVEDPVRLERASDLIAESYLAHLHLR
jgi:hypothetical protein